MVRVQKTDRKQDIHPTHVDPWLVDRRADDPRCRRVYRGDCRRVRRGHQWTGGDGPSVRSLEALGVGGRTKKVGHTPVVRTVIDRGMKV